MSTNKDFLDGITVFVRVVETGGFTTTAELLGHSTSYISKEITRLEKRLGVRLLNRSTRKMSLTDMGRSYFERCSRIIVDAEEAEQSISSQHSKPTGTLRVTSPVSFGHLPLNAKLPLFLEMYPDVKIELNFNERMIDIVDEGFDVAIRAGTLKDSSLVHRKIMKSGGVTVASPDYLGRRGRPLSPQDLANHECISFSNKQAPTHWEFSSENDDVIRVTISPKVITNDAELELSLAVAGVGITRLPSFCCEEEIREGKLEVLLKEYARTDFGVYAVYPHRVHLSTKVRVFVDFLVDQFEQDDAPS
jgi:DNA-binding transcriptional LysR family regulator